MKKLRLILSLIVLTITVQAQQWETNLNSGGPYKFGMSSNNPINFYTNNHLVMKLTTEGKLKLDSLAGSSVGVAYLDENGVFSRQPGTGSGVPCVSTALPWSQGGNSNVGYNTIGTCNYYDFILKANDLQSLFVTTTGNIGIGANNSAPVGVLDVSDNTYSYNTPEHVRIFGDQYGTVQSTSSFKFYHKTGTRYSVAEGSPSSGTPTVNFQIYNGVTSVNTPTLNIGGKTIANNQVNIGAQTNAPYSAWLNINLNNSYSTGSSAENAIDVYNQSTQTVNFRVKASGYVYSKEINVQLTAFPDYVFKSDYELRSLESLEHYIQQNKHLPNVPTAAQIEKDGANLGELSRIQMEKIEELTLYIIDLKKEVDELKKQMNEK